MGRRRVIKSNFYPYHICARSNNKDWFAIPLPTVFDIYADIASKTALKYQIQVHAFVLMGNHFHMLMSTPQENISESMRYFMTESSRRVARTSCRINRIYGSRYHWTIIHSSEHYAHAFKYVLRNPVQAGVTNRVQDYKWTTLGTWHRKFSKLICDNKIGFNECIPKNKIDLLKWLNEDAGKAYQESVFKALKKHQFKFTADKNTGKLPNFTDTLYPKNTPGT